MLLIETLFLPIKKGYIFPTPKHSQTTTYTFGHFFLSLPIERSQQTTRKVTLCLTDLLYKLNYEVPFSTDLSVKLSIFPYFRQTIIVSKIERFILSLFLFLSWLELSGQENNSLLAKRRIKNTLVVLFNEKKRYLGFLCLINLKEKVSWFWWKYYCLCFFYIKKIYFIHFLVFRQDWNENRDSRNIASLTIELDPPSRVTSIVAVEKWLEPTWKLALTQSTQLPHSVRS